MVSCLLHACLVSALFVTVSFWVVFCCLFFVRHFSMYFELVVCLPPLGKDTTRISFFTFASYFL